MSKTNLYTELKARHEADINGFPMQFAFNASQFTEGMVALGLDPSEKDKVCSIGGGGFVRKADVDRLEAMMQRHEDEREAAIAVDETGAGYIYDALLYELANHEYGLTLDDAPALMALGITTERAEGDQRITWALSKAKKAIRFRAINNKQGD